MIGVEDDISIRFRKVQRGLFSRISETGVLDAVTVSRGIFSHVYTVYRSVFRFCQWPVTFHRVPYTEQSLFGEVARAGL